jgi:hypothetical protein
VELFKRLDVHQVVAIQHLLPSLVIHPSIRGGLVSFEGYEATCTPNSDSKYQFLIHEDLTSWRAL